MLILGILGYMLTYIRGNPPNPTYTPQPQQQQLHINQFQVYKCQDCLKWPMVPKISMKSPWKDYKIPKQMSKTLAQVFGGFSRFFHGLFTGFSRSFHGLFTVQILWEISGRYFHPAGYILFCIWWHHDLRCRRLRRARAPRRILLASHWTKWPFYPHIYWPFFPTWHVSFLDKVYNGSYKHSYLKEHLPTTRFSLAVSKDQVKLGRRSAYIYNINSLRSYGYRITSRRKSLKTDWWFH